MTGNVFTALIMGMVVTMVIQSSSATTVMVVGFVNAGIMTLKQSVGVILGAKIGTTVTAQILRLSGGDGSGNLFMDLLKPKNLAYIIVLVAAPAARARACSAVGVFPPRQSRRQAAHAVCGMAAVCGVSQLQHDADGIDQYAKCNNNAT